MASEPEPVDIIGPLKATRMLLDGSAVLVRREEWERLQALLAERDAEVARLVAAGEGMAKELRSIAREIAPKGARGQIVNQPGEVAAREKVREIEAALKPWRAALAARGGAS